jgi:pyruvate kinase
VDPATRKTKIIMALAPLRWEAKEVVGLIDGGMNVARLDFKTGDQKVSLITPEKETILLNFIFFVC